MTGGPLTRLGPVTDDTAPRAGSDVRPPSLDADEATTLLTFLGYLREAVVGKLEGLSEEDARRPGVASGTSLLWLVRHLTAVELNWFEWAYAGQGERPEEDDELPPDGWTVATAVAAYRDAVARADAVAAGALARGLDRPGVRSLRPDDAAGPSMRWVLVHMIEETARHAGHADILREQLDGAVGR